MDRVSHTMSHDEVRAILEGAKDGFVQDEIADSGDDSGDDSDAEELRQRQLRREQTGSLLATTLSHAQVRALMAGGDVSATAAVLATDESDNDGEVFVEHLADAEPPTAAAAAAETEAVAAAAAAAVRDVDSLPHVDVTDADDDVAGEEEVAVGAHNHNLASPNFVFSTRTAACCAAAGMAAAFGAAWLQSWS